jgi:hypothetical protein
MLSDFRSQHWLSMDPPGLCPCQAQSMDSGWLNNHEQDRHGGSSV